MRIRDNDSLHAEARRQLGMSGTADPARLSRKEFDRYLERLDIIKSKAWGYRNVVICRECGEVHDCPHDADFENAFTRTKICNSCGSRAGFKDVTGRWVPFSVWWNPASWGRGCWAFDFCTTK